MLPGARLQRAVLRERVADARRRRGRATRAAKKSKTSAPAVLPGPPARGDRHGAADHVAAADVLDAPAGRGPRAPSAPARCRGARNWPDGISGLTTLTSSSRCRAEDLDHAEVVGALLGLDQARRARRGSPRAAGRCAVTCSAIRPAVHQRALRRPLVVALGHLAALLERAVDLHAEPAVDRLRDDHRRDREEQRRRDERDQHEGGHELEIQVRAERAAAALADQLPEIARDEESEQQDQDHDDRVEEQEEPAGGDAPG